MKTAESEETLLQESRPPGDGEKSNNEDEGIDQVPLYRSRRIIIPAFIVLLAAAAGAWYWYVSVRDFISTDDAYIDANRVSISPKILGRITHLTVDEADTVVIGQLLVQLDDTDIRAQKDQAVASLRLAEEGVTLARVNLARAQDDYQRAEQQYKNGVITKEQYDHAANALDAAHAENGIALSRVGTAKAQVAIVQTQLDNCAIVSPVDGRVAKRWVLAGDVVQPGQPIFSIYDRKETWVTANLEETNLHAVRLNDDVGISVDSYPGREFFGRVFQIGSSTAAQFSLIPPNNASGNFTKVTQRVPIKISIQERSAPDKPPAMLLPGMSVEVKVKVR